MHDVLRDELLPLSAYGPIEIRCSAVDISIITLSISSSNTCTI